MKHRILIMALAVVVGCSKEDELADALMTNGSFELNGNFSTEDWTVSGGSSSADVPTGGGSYALRLDPQGFPGEGYAEYVISGLTGTQDITITAFIKAFGDWPGSITIRKRTADNVLTVLATASSNTNVWEEKTLAISGNFEEGDELIIKLSAGSTEIPVDTKYVLFDLITVTQN